LNNKIHQHFYIKSEKRWENYIKELSKYKKTFETYIEIFYDCSESKDLADNNESLIQNNIWLKKKKNCDKEMWFLKKKFWRK
jgi:hypothetical protein